MAVARGRLVSLVYGMYVLGASGFRVCSTIRAKLSVRVYFPFCF